MENHKIKELSTIIEQLNFVTNKQAELVMTSDNRIVTVQDLIAENDMLLKNGFSDIQPITTQKTKLRDRLVNLQVVPNDFNADSIEKIIKQEINNFYMQQGIPVVDINITNQEYDGSLLLLIALFESKLQEIYKTSEKILVTENTKQGGAKTLYEKPIASAMLFDKPINPKTISHRENISSLTDCRMYNSVKHTDEIALFFTLKNKKVNEYKLGYHFDMLSVLYLKKHISNDNFSIDFWNQKLANLLTLATKKSEKECYIPQHNLQAYHDQVITCSTKEELKDAINLIKIKLLEEKLDSFSNINKLNVNNIKDRSTKNYELFRYYRKALKKPKENNINEACNKEELLEYKKILSLADGFGINEKTSEFLSNNLIFTTTPITIVAADVSSPPRAKSYNYLNYTNITIKRIQLNNQRPFIYQGLQEKFDIVVMRNGLCHCDHKSSTSNSCGGIPMYELEGLKLFLFQIESVLDTSNKNVNIKAIITGKNVREYYFWKQDIQEFNSENRSNLVAEITRDKAGVFKGILIYVQQSSRC